MQTAPLEVGAPPDGAHAVDQLIARVRSADPVGTEELRRVFGRGIRCLAARHLAPDETDQMADEIVIATAEAIWNGDLGSAEKLVTFMRNLVRREIAERGNCQVAITIDDRHRSQAMEQVLLSFSRREREALVRFFLLEDTPEQICRDLGLNETQFRVLKAKARCSFRERKNHVAGRSGAWALCRLVQRFDMWRAVRRRLAA